MLMQVKKNNANRQDRRERCERRIRRERHTVGIMVHMLCKRRHARAQQGIRLHGSPGALCPECAALLDYALRKVDACPFGAEKPACVRCTVYCYRPEMREKIRVVMRYSGPRMTFRHPYLAVMHLLDRRNGCALSPLRRRSTHIAGRPSVRDEAR